MRCRSLQTNAVMDFVGSTDVWFLFCLWLMFYLLMWINNVVFFQTMMADLVHYMGGGIRKDFSAKVTHLVAMRSGGEKYRVSSCFIFTLL